MSPTILTLIIQGITALLSAAPQIGDLVIKTKDLITSLFTSKMITKEQQDAIHAHIDAINAMRLAGIVQPQWQVEPDPGTSVVLSSTAIP